MECDVGCVSTGRDGSVSGDAVWAFCETKIESSVTDAVSNFCNVLFKLRIEPGFHTPRSRKINSHHLSHHRSGAFRQDEHMIAQQDGFVDLVRNEDARLGC